MRTGAAELEGEMREKGLVGDPAAGSDTVSYSSIKYYDSYVPFSVGVKFSSSSRIDRSPMRLVSVMVSAGSRQTNKSRQECTAKH